MCPERGVWKALEDPLCPREQGGHHREDNMGVAAVGTSLLDSGSGERSVRGGEEKTPLRRWESPRAQAGGV